MCIRDRLSGPKPSEDGAPKISARTATKRHAFLRPQWNLSRKMDTMVSIREIADVKAAKNTSRKKIVPIAPPNFMLANTFGSVMNISPGPALSAERSPPENANTAGMIIRPARKAMPDVYKRQVPGRIYGLLWADRRREDQGGL